MPRGELYAVPNPPLLRPKAGANAATSRLGLPFMQLMIHYLSPHLLGVDFLQNHSVHCYHPYIFYHQHPNDPSGLLAAVQTHIALDLKCRSLRITYTITTPTPAARRASSLVLKSCVAATINKERGKAW